MIGFSTGVKWAGFVPKIKIRCHVLCAVHTHKPNLALIWVTSLQTEGIWGQLCQRDEWSRSKTVRAIWQSINCQRKPANAVFFLVFFSVCLGESLGHSISFETSLEWDSLLPLKVPRWWIWGWNIGFCNQSAVLQSYQEAVITGLKGFETKYLQLKTCYQLQTPPKTSIMPFKICIVLNANNFTHVVSSSVLVRNSKISMRNRKLLCRLENETSTVTASGYFKLRLAASGGATGETCRRSTLIFEAAGSEIKKRISGGVSHTLANIKPLLQKQVIHSLKTLRLCQTDCQLHWQCF